MAFTTGVGTTYALPNYQGQLFALTPTVTPLLSATGGLTGGRKAQSTQIEWQTYDLRAGSQRTRLEGAAAPTAEERIRANVRNVLQIHQEAVAVSYTKSAAISQLNTPTSAPYFTADDADDNPVVDELTFQLSAAIAQIGKDVNWSFWNGLFQNPTDNTTARKTKGLMQAITTNVNDKSVVSYTGFTSATDTITGTHALSNGDKVVFSNTDVATGIVAGQVYYVVNISTTVSFKVSLTLGGSPITLGTASNLALRKPWTTALTKAVFEDTIQMAYDSGGFTGDGTATICCSSAQKRAITTAYVGANSTDPFQGTRTVGGLNMQQLVTDFGVFNVMLDRDVPRDTIAVLSLEEIAPVFMETPGKGVFYAEPLAKTGAFDAVQLYGEIGLQWGAEITHAVARGLAV